MIVARSGSLVLLASGQVYETRHPNGAGGAWRRILGPAKSTTDASLPSGGRWVRLIPVDGAAPIVGRWDPRDELPAEPTATDQPTGVR